MLKFLNSPTISSFVKNHANLKLSLQAHRVFQSLCKLVVHRNHPRRYKAARIYWHKYIYTYIETYAVVIRGPRERKRERTSARSLSGSASSCLPEFGQAG